MQGKIYLSISYFPRVLDTWETNNLVPTTSHGVSSTVPVSKLGNILVACFGIVLQDSNPDCGIRDFNRRDIERELHTMLSVAHVAFVLTVSNIART
jgi:hypothetical protein